MAISDFVPKCAAFCFGNETDKMTSTGHESGEDKSDVRVHVYEGEQWEEKIK